MSGLTLDDVHAAARRLLNRITRTPVITSQSWDDASGFSVFFKCENLQRAGSFKIRGALNKLLTLSADERRRGVVAFSSGNHAQGVALAARLVGTTAVVCMPKDAPLLKVQATRGYGAEIVVYDRHTEDREAIARRIASETGRVVVPPFDDEAIMAGQGTAALELLQDVPSLDALVAPVGGGGLMAGCGTVARTLFPGMQIIGVEPETANDTWLSIQKGERVSIPPPPTIADGVRLTTPGELTFPILQQTLSDVALPFDDEAIMAGQGTAALELLQDVPSLDALVAPVGGGGLMAGCGTVARTLFPGMQIIGVEPETANDTWLSIQKGERVSIPPPPTIADGVRLTTPGELTFPILQQTLSDVALVTDDEIRAALRYLVLRAHVVVEPTGAVAAAAVLSGKVPLERGARVGGILSGGNIDPPLLSEILETT
ncbi:MAG: hypothetical protein AUG80_08480 [Candidatus Rokubacteria bacterium 13_1_20CM_4_68_9]|nr:MAG: hypothetical protein AUG80_08480 [Candidatus Rokubacteria bacterium 13_1_20CM_4_68_9]